MITQNRWGRASRVTLGRRADTLDLHFLTWQCEVAVHMIPQAHSFQYHISIVTGSVWDNPTF